MWGKLVIAGLDTIIYMYDEPSTRYQSKLRTSPSAAMRLNVALLAAFTATSAAATTPVAFSLEAPAGTDIWRKPPTTDVWNGKGLSSTAESQC